MRRPSVRMRDLPHIPLRLLRSSLLLTFLGLRANEMPPYFKHQSVVRPVALGITAAAMAPSVSLLLRSTDWSMPWYLYILFSVALFVGFFALLCKLLGPANQLLIWLFGGEQLHKKKRDCALEIVTALFDRKPTVDFPDEDDDLVMREAVRSFRKYFEEGGETNGSQESKGRS